MYFISVVLLMLVMPLVSAGVYAHTHQFEDPTVMFLIGKWWTFWAVGVRLFLAGVRQVVQPKFTAEEIFRIRDEASFALVREIGFGNLAMGVAGLWSIKRPEWLIPIALIGGLYYGLAGLGHIARKNRNTNEQIAMVSDLLVFVLLGASVVVSLI